MFFLFANMIKLVLFTLSDNLLTLNHISSFSSYSPVPCVISLKFLGDLQSYTFLERLGPTEPEK